MSDYTYSEYWESVRGMVSDIMEEHADGDSARDAVWQTVDGSCWVTYYARAFAALQHSENESAIDDAGDAGDISPGDFWSYIAHAAFYAMAADVADRLEAALEEREEAEEEEEAEEGGGS